MERNRATVAKPVLQEGRNCWRKRRAERSAFLIDADAYFSAFVSAVEQAERSVYIAGWDIHSRVQLIRDDGKPNDRYRLGAFLNQVAANKPGLMVYVLAWDFAMIFALERDPFLVFKLGWNTHKNVRFHLDGEHPLGASHHQKIVVVDDAAAFAGGLDLTQQRWDTSDHRPHDANRTDPTGKQYRPFHDVQLAVDGDAAAALGDLFRRRWRHATREELSVPKGAFDPWPKGVEPDVLDVDIGISRTEAAYQDRREVREVESLYVDAIASAERCIYIENQYLTSEKVSRALEERLRVKDGPEVVLVLPLHNTGWLEEQTMATQRAAVVRDLRNAAPDGRFRALYPQRENEGDGGVKVHAKVQIVDDDFVRVGSSNISNRSMGLDTECDLAFEANGDQRIANAIRLFRNRLIAEHMGTEVAEVETAHARNKSMIRAISELSGGPRRLETLPDDKPATNDIVLPAATHIADPERPIEPERLIDQFVEDEMAVRSPVKTVGFALLFIAMLALAVAWRWGPLSEIALMQSLSDLVAAEAGSAYIVPLILGLFVLGSVTVVPVTILILAMALVFDPLISIMYSFAGSLASAMVSFAIGHHLGKDTIRSLAGERLNRVSKRLATRGVWTVFALRIVPVAPYAIVNLVMGSSHVRFKDFVIGTLLGMAPGIVALSILGKSLSAALAEQKAENYIYVGIAALSAVAVLLVLRKIVMSWFKKENAVEKDKTATAND